MKILNNLFRNIIKEEMEHYFNEANNEVEYTYDTVLYINEKWKKLPSNIKDKYKHIHFNLFDKQVLSMKQHQVLMELIGEKMSNKVSNDKIWINYPDYKVKYAENIYRQSKKNKYVESLINFAKKHNKLSSKQHFQLSYYIKNGELPYQDGVLPNNY